MNYIRKVVALILTLVFCAALVVGAGVALSIKNVNVEYIYYTTGGDDDYAYSAKQLNTLKGTNLLFLEEEDILRCIGTKGTICVASYEKVFPCTLNVVLKERRETFARQNENGLYAVYDEDGTFIRGSAQNLNEIDGCPNVLLEAENDDFDDAVRTSQIFKNYFGSLRNLVKKVFVTKDLVTDCDNITFSLYSGVEIMISDYTVYTEEKISACKRVFASLSDENKLRGWVMCVCTGNDVSGVYAEYVLAV